VCFGKTTTATDRWFISNHLLRTFLKVPSLFSQTVSKDDFPDGSVKQTIYLSCVLSCHESRPLYSVSQRDTPADKASLSSIGQKIAGCPLLSPGRHRLQLQLQLPPAQNNRKRRTPLILNAVALTPCLPSVRHRRNIKARNRQTGRKGDGSEVAVFLANFLSVFFAVSTSPRVTR